MEVIGSDLFRRRVLAVLRATAPVWCLLGLALLLWLEKLAAESGITWLKTVVFLLDSVALFVLLAGFIHIVWVDVKEAWKSTV